MYIDLRDNQDVMREKPVKNDAGQPSLDEEAKKEAWREHYGYILLNIHECLPRLFRGEY